MKPIDVAWNIIKYHPLSDDFPEEREKAEEFHRIRAAAQRPTPAIRTIADPSDYHYMLGSIRPFDFNSPKTNPFPGGEPTIHEMMADATRDERTQHLIDNFVPQPAETKPPAPTGSNPVQPPKSDMSPQGSFSTRMGPPRKQKRGEMGRGVAVKRPGFRSSEAMPLPESAKDRERKLTFSRRL
tara:strand:- start:137 stop:685 length:549 start_codon:yes stop_codon:yes gene_type:complete